MGWLALALGLLVAIGVVFRWGYVHGFYDGVVAHRRTQLRRDH